MADLLVDRHEHVTVFTINRPDRMNSLGGTVMSDLTEAVRDFEADPNQYVAIVTGSGDKAFSAGGDLTAMAEGAASGSSLPISPGPDMAGLAA